MTPDLVKFILENADRFPWSIQGLGMLRLYLSPAVRLHVWSGEAKRPDVSTRHDHPWDFESTIVSGYITNVLYRFTFRAPFVDTDELSGFENYMEQQIVCGPGGGMDAEPKPVELSIDHVRTYGPGETYSQDRNAIHESQPTDGTVTIIRRRAYKDTEHAHVYYRIGTIWVSAEPREATSAEVEHITQRALAVWDPRNRTPKART